MRKWILLLAYFLLSWTAWAGPKEEIEASYSKMNQAARYKFIEGMLGARLADFEAFDPKGKRINLRFEKRQLAGLLSRALKIQAETRVLKVQERGEDMEAEVQETLQVSLAQTPESPVQELVVLSHSKDLWVRTPERWRLKSSHVVEQSIKPAAK